MAKVKYKPPKSYHAVTPYLAVDGAADAIAFYQATFGAKERYRLQMGDKIGHAELDFGGSTIMLSDVFPEHGKSPLELDGSASSLTLYVADADAVFERAVEAGAKIERPLQDQFYGDRSGRLVDPFGHRWSIQQRLEDVSPKKMQKRLDAMMASTAKEPEPEQANGEPATSTAKAKAKSKR